MLGSMTRCRRCGAEILFARTASGARMPMEPRPYRREELHRAGRWIIVDAGGFPALERSAGIDTAEEVYGSHYAACPTGPDSTRLEPAVKARKEEYRRQMESSANNRRQA